MKVYKVKWNMPYYVGPIMQMKRFDKSTIFKKFEEAEKFRNDLCRASVVLQLPEFESSIVEDNING